MEAMHITRQVCDGERVVDAFCFGCRFHDGDGMAELLEQHDHARAKAGKVIGVVQHDLKAVAAACEEKGAQQFEAPQGVVPAVFQIVVKNAQVPPREFDQDIERFLIFRNAVDLPAQQNRFVWIFAQNNLIMAGVNSSWKKSFKMLVCSHRSCYVASRTARPQA